VFNLAATRPDLLTGVNPATGQPEPYGSVGVDINCAVIGYTATAPTANLAAPGSQLAVPTKVADKPPHRHAPPRQADGRHSTSSTRRAAIAGLPAVRTPDALCLSVIRNRAHFDQA
jgi:hypothetical protein